MVSLSPSFSLKRSNSIVIEEVALEERTLPPVTWTTVGWAMFTFIYSSWTSQGFSQSFHLFHQISRATWMFHWFSTKSPWFSHRFSPIFSLPQGTAPAMEDPKKLEPPEEMPPEPLEKPMLPATTA
jgi:hypothetical protein